MQLFHYWNICSYHCQNCNVDNALFYLLNRYDGKFYSTLVSSQYSVPTISHDTGVEPLVVQVHVLNGVSVRVAVPSTLGGNIRIIPFIFNIKYLLGGFETIKQ